MEIKTFSAKSDQGPYLQINEDTYDFDFENDLYMVIDGFGGVGNGDTFVNKLKENIKKYFTSLTVDPDKTLPFFYSPKMLLEGNALVNSMLYTQNLMMQENIQKDISTRAGASATFITKTESILTLINVGNCRSYLYRRGKLHKIFTEDSFQFLTNDSYNSHLKTMPMSAFGLFSDLYYQVKEIRVFDGDIVLTVSDGVYGRVSDDEIKDIISQASKPPKERISELFDWANSKGNLDNQTALVLEF